MNYLIFDYQIIKVRNIIQLNLFKKKKVKVMWFV
jgi:hypothetical protein